MIAPPKRTITIGRDACSALYVLRCKRPCRADKMGHPTYCMDDVAGAVGCWLGASLTAEGAAALATVNGYEVAP